MAGVRGVASAVGVAGVLSVLATACGTRQAGCGPRAAAPIEFLQLDWSAERWSGGCYGAHLAPGVLTGFGPGLREPCGRIHWAGTETATVWAGYMEGAVRSGERAAAEVS